MTVIYGLLKGSHYNKHASIMQTQASWGILGVGVFNYSKHQILFWEEVPATTHLMLTLNGGVISSPTDLIAHWISSFLFWQNNKTQSLLIHLLWRLNNILPKSKARGNLQMFLSSKV